MRLTKKHFKKMGLRIRALRKLKKISQTELAMKAGLSQGLISKLEKNGTMGKTENIVALLQAVRIPPERFLRGIYPINWI